VGSGGGETGKRENWLCSTKPSVEATDSLGPSPGYSHSPAPDASGCGKSPSLLVIE